jgi:hypothetical protein
MSKEFRVLSVDLSEGEELPDDLNLQSLRDAVLANPSLALEALKIALSSTTEIGSASGGGFSGSLPTDTPIFKMLTADQAALLSPQAKELTKGELVSLQGPNGPQRMKELGLTVADLKTVEEAFHQRFGASGLEEVEMAMDSTGGEAFDVSSCCCTPCCCCTAVSVTSPLVSLC